MKQQIARLSPHQNAKVAAVVWAVISLIFVIPMFVYLTLILPPQAKQQDPIGHYFFLIMPVIYLIIGYIVVIVGCVIYNFLFRFLGGFEYEARDRQD